MPPAASRNSGRRSSWSSPERSGRLQRPPGLVVDAHASVSFKVATLSGTTRSPARQWGIAASPRPRRPPAQRERLTSGSQSPDAGSERVVKEAISHSPALIGTRRSGVRSRWKGCVTVNRLAARFSASRDSGPRPTATGRLSIFPSAYMSSGTVSCRRGNSHARWPRTNGRRRRGRRHWFSKCQSRGSAVDGVLRCGEVGVRRAQSDIRLSRTASAARSARQSASLPRKPASAGCGCHSRHADPVVPLETRLLGQGDSRLLWPIRFP